MSLNKRIIIPAILLWSLLTISFLYLFSYQFAQQRHIKSETKRAQSINDLSSELLVTEGEIEKSVIAFQINADPEIEEELSSLELDATRIFNDLDPLTTEEKANSLLFKVLEKRNKTLIARQKLVEAIKTNNQEQLENTYYSYDIQQGDMYATILDLINYNLHSVERNAELYNNLLSRTTAIGLGLVAVNTMSIIGLFIIIKMYVTIPIIKITRSAEQIAKGNFDTHISVNSSDELGTLSRSINKMSVDLDKYYKSLEREIEYKEKQLKQSKEFESRKNDFISIASHELKTPLTSLKVFTQLMKKIADEKKHTQYYKYLDKIDAQVNRLTALINSLLDITKMQSGRLEYDFEPINMNVLVKDIVETTNQTTDSHTVTLNGKITKKIIGDTDRLGQVITNLLSNAIKYSPSASRVDVTLSQDTKNAIIQVTDFGIGIDKTQQKKIFERFYRIIDGDVNAFSGLGIGLYLSQRIVKRHKGTLTLESTKGKGTTFTVKIPFVKTVNKKNEKDRNSRR